jgi:hypothetical protein
MIALPTDTQTLTPVDTAPPRRELLEHVEGSTYMMVLDNSSLEKLTTCPRSAEYYLIYRREAHAKNAALVFGGAIHAGIEQLLRLGNTDDALLAAIKAARNYFVSHPPPPDEYRTADIAAEVLVHYAKRATLPDYQWDLCYDSAGPLIERSFELPLGVIKLDTNIQLPTWPEPRYISDVHVCWSGKIDVVVHTNELCRVVDHKTTSISGDQFVQDFQLSNQTTGYVWAARQLWPTLDVTGFCGNAIYLKRPTGGRGYGDSLLARGPRGGEPPLNFFRFYFNYSPIRLEEWENNTLEILSDLLHNLRRSYFPMHTKNCFGKYGRCPYHDVCSIDDFSVRMNLLHSNLYKTVTWDPTR